MDCQFGEDFKQVDERGVNSTGCFLAGVEGARRRCVGPPGDASCPTSEDAVVAVCVARGLRGEELLRVAEPHQNDRQNLIVSERSRMGAAARGAAGRTGFITRGESDS